jgi:homospermidine synthase
VRELGKAYAGGPTAVSCCGANPGMVSWLLKEALLRLAADTGVTADPQTREDWAALMQGPWASRASISPNATRRSRPIPSRRGTFVNTWSVDGLLSEGYQPAELGWGTHEKKLPPHGHAFDHGPGYAIWIDRPGADTRVRSWCPGVGPQFGYVITHNEALSIPDYYTVWAGERPSTARPAIMPITPATTRSCRLHEINGTGKLPETHHILTVDEIVAGGDDLGVFLYGHAKGAMWYGSRLSTDEARRLAPYQNATGMQVTSAVLAAMVWAAENPAMGFVEADEMDHARCLEVQRPYLGRSNATTPTGRRWQHRINRFAEDRDEADPWQFTNFLAV